MGDSPRWTESGKPIPWPDGVTPTVADEPDELESLFALDAVDPDPTRWAR